MNKCELRIGSRGVYRFEITTIGRSGHTGITKSKGINSVTEMAKVLLALQKMKFRYKPKKKFPKPKITPGTVIKGGVGINIYPPECSALVDCRLSYGQTKKSVKEDIAKTLKKIKTPGNQLKYKIRDIAFTPPAYTPESHPIAKICLKHMKKIYGRKPDTTISGGATDGNFVYSHGIPHVIFGPTGDNAHTENEFAHASTIPQTAKAYVAISLEFLKI